MGNENFIKHDSNKIRVGLLEPDFILGVAEVATYRQENNNASR